MSEDPREDADNAKARRDDVAARTVSGDELVASARSVVERVNNLLDKWRARLARK